MRSADVLIVGGGIVGLATAWRLVERRPGIAVIVLEKEKELALHQTGRNSGVLHSGIYYRPGSLKAATCRAGREAMVAFCEREGIPLELCGKVVVAADGSEVAALERLHERGVANGVRCEVIGPERLAELEPHAAGARALHVADTGIVDFRRVALRLAALVEKAGGEVMTGARVTEVRREGTGCLVGSTVGEFRCGVLVNCAGLHSDRVARLAGASPKASIVPFRGEYFLLKPAARRFVRNLIYPVPDPHLPFLGVHFTRTVTGEVECGPNAVLALAREGYRKTDVNVRDVLGFVTDIGFLRMAARHWRAGVSEIARSLSRGAFAKSLRRLVPELEVSDLEPGPAGVRAQAVSRDGALVDDFVVQEQEDDRVVHVLNAPSPAATASLAIAERIAERALAH